MSEPRRFPKTESAKAWKIPGPCFGPKYSTFGIKRPRRVTRASNFDVSGVTPIWVKPQTQSSECYPFELVSSKLLRPPRAMQRRVSESSDVDSLGRVGLERLSRLGRLQNSAIRILSRYLEEPIRLCLRQLRYPRGILVFVGRIRTVGSCLLYTSPSPRDLSTSRMPSSA